MTVEILAVSEKVTNIKKKAKMIRKGVRLEFATPLLKGRGWDVTIKSGDSAGNYVCECVHINSEGSVSRDQHVRTCVAASSHFSRGLRVTLF